jgi:hypothetical protein
VKNVRKRGYLCLLQMFLKQMPDEVAAWVGLVDQEKLEDLQ